MESGTSLQDIWWDKIAGPKGRDDYLLESVRQIESRVAAVESALGTAPTPGANGYTLGPYQTGDDTCAPGADTSGGKNYLSEQVDRARSRLRLNGVISGLKGDEIEVLLFIARRLEQGAKVYGTLDIDDGHDWWNEGNEELADFLVYEAARRIKNDRG